MNQLVNNGDRFEGVILETFIDKNSSRPRVRPVDFFEEDIRVEFPRHLRDENPIGSRFSADLKVSQKTKDGLPFGKQYLVVNEYSIEIIKDFMPSTKIRAIKQNTISDRSYKLIYPEIEEVKEQTISFLDLREIANETAATIPAKYKLESLNKVRRSEIVKIYALTRANGKCEGCNVDAPFLKRNGEPYLEIHHMIELSNDGLDSPLNVIALCPNCHAQITHGLDGKNYNSKLILKIDKIESTIC